MSILKVIEEYKTKKEEIIKLFKETFFQELFDKYENLHFIPILSYTPYFNDGEPCERDTSFYLGSSLDDGLCYINDHFSSDNFEKSSLFNDPKDYNNFFEMDWKYKEENAKNLTLNNKLTDEEIVEIEQTLESVVEFIEEILDDHSINLVKRQGDGVVIFDAEYEHD